MGHVSDVEQFSREAAVFGTDSKPPSGSKRVLANERAFVDRVDEPLAIAIASMEDELRVRIQQPIENRVLLRRRLQLFEPICHRRPGAKAVPPQIVQAAALACPGGCEAEPPTRTIPRAPRRLLATRGGV